MPQALKAGFVEIIQMADIDFEVQGSGLATSRSYIKANREVVKSALKAYVEGIYYVFENRAAAVKTLSRYMRTDDQEVLDYSYQHYLKRTPKKPYPTMKGIQNLIDMSAPQVAQAKIAKPEQSVDLAFLQELERSGFLRRWRSDTSKKIVQIVQAVQIAQTVIKGRKTQFSSTNAFVSERFELFEPFKRLEPIFII